MSNKNYLQRMLGRFQRRKDPIQNNTGSAVRNVPCRNGGDFDEFASSWCRTSGNLPVNARSLQKILNDADEGAPGELAMLFRRILESEPAIAAHIQTRIYSVLSCDWSICSETASDRAIEAEKILRDAGIYELLRHLLGAISFGYAGSAIIWDEGGRGILSFRHIDPANFVFDPCGNPALITLDGREKPLVEYHENQFVFHSQQLQTASPSRGGLLRALVRIWFFKHYAMRDHARFLERFGIPFITAKIRNEDFESESMRTQLLNSLSKLGSDGVGLLNEDADVQIVSPSGGSSGDYQKWLEYLDSLCALLILGQTATSSDGSGFTNSAVQENVRRDLVEADCRALVSTVERAVLQPLERFRWGTENTLHLKLDYASPENLLEKAQIIEKLTSAGIRVDGAWIEKTFGITLNKTQD